MTDPSARTAATELERLALDGLGYGIVVCDGAGRVHRASPRAAEMVGRDHTTIAGVALLDLVAPADRVLVDDAIVAARQGRSGGAVTCQMAINARTPWHAVELAPIGPDPDDAERALLAIRRADTPLAVDEPVRLLAGGQPLPDVLGAVVEAVAAGGAGLPVTVLWDRHDGAFGSSLASRGIDVLDGALDHILMSADADPARAPLPWDAFRGLPGAPVPFETGDLPTPLDHEALALGIAKGWMVSVGAETGLPDAVLLVWGINGTTTLRPALRQRLQRMTGLARVAFEHERMEQQLLHAAGHDPLTGLINRARFFAVVERQARRGPVAVIYVDLDGFKQVNERFGHAAGDDVLVEVARRFEDAVRPTDVIARLGGDEFAVLCTDAPGEAVVVRIAERLADELAQPITTAAGPVRVGASLGMALSEARSHADAVIDAADHAVLEVKRTGRALVAARLVSDHGSGSDAAN